MTERITVGCKINLALQITGIKKNGYHELSSLFWPLASPCDTLEFSPCQHGGLQVLCKAHGIDPASNTLTKAYQLYAASTGFAPHVQILLQKGIPHGAGLGGGSSDAAAVLQWCNARAPRPLNLLHLSALAVTVGADVPFFLHNVPCHAKGIGEKLQPVHNFLQGRGLLLVCPPIKVSTPWAYAAWDKAQKEKFFLEDLTMTGGKAKSLVSCGSWFINDFENVVFKAHPELGELKAALLRQGAQAAVMSGSGSSMVGIFSCKEAAKKASQHLEPGIAFYTSVL